MYKTQLYLKLSKLRYPALLEELSYSKERNLDKEHILQLADCSYIDRAENILISGATGAGKSFLACALGHQACVMGYKALYLNLNRFTEKIMVAKLDGSFVKILNQLERVNLLILDDFGLAPMDQNTRLALLQILEDRYNVSTRRSTSFLLIPDIRSCWKFSNYAQIIGTGSRASGSMARVWLESPEILHAERGLVFEV